MRLRMYARDIFILILTFLSPRFCASVNLYVRANFIIAPKPLTDFQLQTLAENIVNKCSL
jgi:hypothetical protein